MSRVFLAVALWCQIVVGIAQTNSTDNTSLSDIALPPREGDTQTSVLRLSPIPDSVKSVVPTPDVPAGSWMLVDFESGWILGEQNKDARIEPASLTKLMTSFLVFDALSKLSTSTCVSTWTNMRDPPVFQAFSLI